MLRFMQIQKLAQADDGTGDGGSGYSAEADAPTPAPTAAAPTQDDNIDELGYEIIPEDKGTENTEGEGDKKPEPVKAADDKVEKPATGYGEDVVVEEEPAAPVEPTKDVELGFEIKAEGLPKAELDGLKAFAAKHKLPKEAVQEYADLLKGRYEKAEEMRVNAEKERVKTRASWQSELKKDPNFGGEKYGHNVMRAEKVLEDFMPGTKKMLTERGSMLPPYVMRDLAKMADVLYSTDKLVQGDPSKPSLDEKESDDALSFYT